MKPLFRKYITSIDLGSSKISCWIAQDQDAAPPTLIGCAHVGSRGLWGAQITDVPSLQKSLATALYEAEQHAQAHVRQANILLPNAWFRAQVVAVETPVRRQDVTQEDIDALAQQIVHPGLHPVHIQAIEFRVDHHTGLKNPLGAVGRTLGARFHVLWMDQNLWATVQSCLKRCQIQALHILPSSLGQATACLNKDEMDLGVALIDLGASTTTLSLFLKGGLVAYMTLPLGSHHITQDIARGCDTPLAHSERIKILHGAAMRLSHDHHDTVPLLPMSAASVPDADPTSHVPRSFLISIIQARIQDILGRIQSALASSPYGPLMQRVVLTGGGSQLTGLCELGKRLFGRSVRVATPPPLTYAPRRHKPHDGGLIQGPARESPEFAAVAGGLMYQASGLGTSGTEKRKFLKMFSWLTKKI